MRLAVVGRGAVGGGLADRWERAGHDVLRIGRDGGDVADREALLVAVPALRITAALTALDGVDGQAAIDATNAYDGRDERYDSLAHEVRAATGGPVAKAFNLQYARLHERLDAEPTPPDNLYAADDDARTATERLIVDAGYAPLFVGGLEHARTLEDATAVFRLLRQQHGPYFHHYSFPDGRAHGPIG